MTTLSHRITRIDEHGNRREDEVDIELAELLKHMNSRDSPVEKPTYWIKKAPTKRRKDTEGIR